VPSRLDGDLNGLDDINGYFDDLCDWFLHHFSDGDWYFDGFDVLEGLGDGLVAEGGELDGDFDLVGGGVQVEGGFNDRVDDAVVFLDAHHLGVLVDDMVGALVDDMVGGVVVAAVVEGRGG